MHNLIERIQAKLAHRHIADPETIRRVTDKYTRATNTPPQSPVQYIGTICLPNGKPYTFHQHDDLIQIAQDRAQTVVVRKAAQKGVTELMIRIQFWLASRGYNSAYFLKSRTYMKLLVQSRVEPVIAANKHLIHALTPSDNENNDDTPVPHKYRLTDNLMLKRLYGATLLYMGLQSEADVRSFPLDAIIIDEVETLKPELADALQERLYHSTLKWERWFSQPTAVNYGIDERFQITDQRHQLFTCPKCNAEFSLEETFPACFAWVDEAGKIVSLLSEHAEPPTKQSTPAYICPNCHTPINPLHTAWRWVAKYPSRADYGHGYQLTQLYSTTMSAGEIVRLYRMALSSPIRLERFYNSILGLPYAGGDTQPIHPDKLAYYTTLPPQEAPRYAGVDVGDALSLVIIEQRDRAYIIHIAELRGPNKWDDLRAILQKYHIRAVGVNAMPYKDSAKRLLRALQPNIDGALIYDTSDDARPSMGTEDAEYGEPVKRIAMPRTELMDATVHALLSHAVVPPQKHLHNTYQLLKHLQNYIVERDPQGNRRYARGREDHLGRALDYALAIARVQFGYLPPNMLTPNNIYTPIPLTPQIL